MNLRTLTEEKEYQTLSPFAQKSRETKGRTSPTEPCDLRTEFQRDRDKIVHSKAFRRLKHKTQVFFKVVLLQVVKRIIPPMSNEIITLIKDTSLANTIAVYELIFEAKEFMTVKGLIWPLFVAGAFYLVFVGILTIVFGQIEKKLDYFKS